MPHLEPAVPQAGEGLDVACGAGAEAEVLPHHDERGVQGHEEALDELLGGHRRHVRAEADDPHLVRARVLEQVDAGAEIRQELRRLLGAQHADRMRPEGDDDQRRLDVAARLLEHLLVPAVHAVEVADDDDRSLPTVSHSGQMWHAHTSTATGREPASVGR